MQNLKKKKRGKKETERMFPQKGIEPESPAWQTKHDNHYTTPIADSLSEIKYLYR